MLRTLRKPARSRTSAGAPWSKCSCSAGAVVTRKEQSPGYRQLAHFLASGCRASACAFSSRGVGATDVPSTPRLCHPTERRQAPEGCAERRRGVCWDSQSAGRSERLRFPACPARACAGVSWSRRCWAASRCCARPGASRPRAWPSLPARL